MIGKFHLPISAGGSLPDPATYCPANGYILNPINPADGWVLLAEFQTNSPYTTTFDPVIVASSGEYAWDLGDGTILVGQKSVSHTYLTTATRTVKLYGKGTCTITGIDFRSDDIIGILDISNDAFKPLTTIQVFSNASMTGLLLPSTMTGIMGTLYAYSCNITGTLNLSMITAWSTIADIRVNSNSLMTGVTFASVVTGTIAILILNSCNITGVLNLSMFTSFSATNANIYLQSNPLMTGVTFAGVVTGTIAFLHIYGCKITGTLNISMFTSFTSAADIQLYNNTLMTNITTPTSITGIVKVFYVSGCTSLGYVNMLGYLSTGVINLSWDFRNNVWAASIVNHVLVDIDVISASGFTGRVITIGGTNADPDTTSGGYDGVAARNSLIAKGFTVTIT